MDYISKEDALGSICIDCSAQRDCRPGERCVDYMRIKAIPAADVRPVVRGKDIWKSHDSHCEFKCSVCGAWAGEVAGGTLDGGPFNFCPNCGAKLEADHE